MPKLTDQLKRLLIFIIILALAMWFENWLQK